MDQNPGIRLRTPDTGLDSLPESLHPVIRRILLGRGITRADDLDLGLRRLASPESLSGLARAAGLLAQAVMNGQRILVVGDFDADGATGTALAVRALKDMGAAQIDFRVPNRFEFGYGLTPALVETMRDDPPDVLVTVDAGINCIKGVSTARALGCTVIVTDHHLPGQALPDADAIVNPNSPGDEFPSKSLAGVGVVFYLLSALRRVLREAAWFAAREEPVLARYLDLVALGTVADLVSLDHNNRVLVRQGMERIRQGMACPGLLALLRLGKRDYRHLVASDLGFAVAPRLNAAGRLEDMSVGIRCLLSDDTEEAWALAGELDALNRQRRGMQNQMQSEAMEQVRSMLLSLKGSELPLSLCLHDPCWHQGIVGLVASKVKEAAHRPVIAFAPEAAGSDVLKGSARSISGLHIRDVLAHVDATHPGMMKAYGGHAMAAGLSLNTADLEGFRAAFDDSVAMFLHGKAPAAELLTDGELKGTDINLEFALKLRELGPWGQQFPEPLFEGAFEVIDQRVVGGAHLKMVVRPLDTHDPVDSIAFGKLPEDLPDGNVARFLYRLDVNHFRGEQSCQLVVEHIVRD